MGAKFELPDNKPKKRQRLEAGTYPARCIQVVELGTHDNIFDPGKKKKDILLAFETMELMEPLDDGTRLPFVLSITVTNSMHEMAKLREYLESWRNASFTEEELKTFSVSKVLGKPCLLGVELKKKGDKEFNNIKSISAPMKGMDIPEAVNPLVDFGIEDMQGPEFEQLWPWVQDIIKKSDEAKAIGFTGVSKQLPDADSDDNEKMPF